MATSTQDRIVLSVIVTCFSLERFKDVADLLLSLRNQTHRMLQVIVVVERSQELADMLLRYVEELRMKNVQIVFNSFSEGLSASRNLGISKASGDIVAFLDDDVVAEPDWAAEIVRTFDDGSVIGVTGACNPLFVDTSLNWLPTELYWMIGCTTFSGLSQIVDVRNAWGMNMAFARLAFDIGCRFPESFGLRSASNEKHSERPSEDVEFSIAVKLRTSKRLVFNPTAVVKHKVYGARRNTRYFITRAFLMGRQRRVIRALHERRLAEELNYSASDPLQPERELLRKIFTHLVPRTLRHMLSDPILSWFEFSATVVVLFSMLLGYVSYKDEFSSNALAEAIPVVSEISGSESLIRSTDAPQCQLTMRKEQLGAFGMSQLHEVLLTHPRKLI